MLVSSELVFQFDPVQSNAGAVLGAVSKSLKYRSLRITVALLDTVAFSQTACPLGSCEFTSWLFIPRGRKAAETPDTSSLRSELIDLESRARCARSRSSRRSFQSSAKLPEASTKENHRHAELSLRSELVSGIRALSTVSAAAVALLPLTFSRLLVARDL